MLWRPGLKASSLKRRRAMQDHPAAHLRCQLPGRLQGHETDDVSVFDVWHISHTDMSFGISARIFAYQSTFGVSARILAGVKGGFIGNTYLLYPLPLIHKDDPVYH